MPDSLESAVGSSSAPFVFGAQNFATSQARDALLSVNYVRDLRVVLISVVLEQHICAVRVAFTPLQQNPFGSLTSVALHCALCS